MPRASEQSVIPPSCPTLADHEAPTLSGLGSILTAHPGAAGLRFTSHVLRKTENVKPPYHPCGQDTKRQPGAGHDYCGTNHPEVAGAAVNDREGDQHIPGQVVRLAFHQSKAHLSYSDTPIPAHLNGPLVATTDRREPEPRRPTESQQAACRYSDRAPRPGASSGSRPERGAVNHGKLPKSKVARIFPLAAPSGRKISDTFVV